MSVVCGVVSNFPQYLPNAGRAIDVRGGIIAEFEPLWPGRTPRKIEKRRGRGVGGQMHFVNTRQLTKGEVVNAVGRDCHFVGRIFVIFFPSRRTG